MKKTYVLFIVVISFITVAVFGAKVVYQKQGWEMKLIHKSIISGSNETNQTKQKDTSIILTTPQVNCGRIPWNDPIILKWFEENYLGSGGTGVSKYKFSGWISNFDKSWKLTVVITTNQDWPQPVTIDKDGIFDGAVYFDDANHGITPIKITLTNSTGKIIKRCIITLTN